VPYFLRVPLDSGETMLVDVTGKVNDLVPAGLSGDVVGQLRGKLGDNLTVVQEFSSQLLAKLRDGAVPPDVVSVEFGLDLTAKAGVVVAESTATAHVKVTVEWHRPSADGAVAPFHGD
jgi:hypothetical protein